MAEVKGEPVNLNRFAKQKARENAKTRAAENAVRFGRSKGAKDRAQAQAAKATRDLDGHKRAP